MRASKFSATFVLGLAAATACGSSNNGAGTGAATTGSNTTTSTSNGSGTLSTSTGTGSPNGATSTSTGSGAGGRSGTTTTTTTSTSSGAGNGGSAAATFPFPQASFGSGPVLAAPKIVTITFPGDALATDLAAFGDQITTSSDAYWATVTSDLTCGGKTSCISNGSGIAKEAAAAPAESSYTDYAGGTAPSGQAANTLQPYLQTLITASGVTPDANTLFVFYFPSSVTITLDGQTSCQTFGGYHNSIPVSKTENIAYAIVPECPLPDAGPSLTLTQQTTFAASHEIVEGATDAIIAPEGSTAAPSGYYMDLKNQNSYGWLDLGDGELADLCVDQLGFGQDEATEGGYTVQRIWSVANAAAGNLDPCVPSNGKTYFNAFPTVSAVIVADVGASTTFDVYALALGTEPEWTVAVEDITGSLAGNTTDYLSFAIGGKTQSGTAVAGATSGATVPVTVTMLVDPKDAPESEGWGDGLVISLNGTDPQAATSGNYWPFIVLTAKEAAMLNITMGEAVPPRIAERVQQRAIARAKRNAARRGYKRPRFLDKLWGIKWN